MSYFIISLNKLYIVKNYVCKFLIKYIMEKLSEKQKNILLPYMEKHKSFARKRIGDLGPQGFQTFKKMWEKLSTNLNNSDGPKRNIKGWQQVSFFYKCLI